MASTDFDDRSARRVRRAYERSRWQLALVGFAPVLLVPVLVMCLDGITMRTVALGGLLFLAGVVVLWRGRDAARGVLPGVLAGLIPLTAALCAPSLHVCMGGACLSGCLAACAAGGLGAGIVVGLASRRTGHGVAMLGTAAALSLLTGAIGCACLGYAGVVGMAAGFALGALPWIARLNKA